MKKNITQIIIIWILGIGTGFAQSELPFFEQIAFNFYGKEILKVNPVKKRISIYRYYMDFQKAGNYLPSGECFKKPIFENQVAEIDEDVYGQNNIDSEKFEMDLSKLDKKQFKVRRNGRGSYPKLFLSYPMVSKKEPNRFFVNISETYDRLVNIYHIEMDENGEVIDWCKSYHETIITH